MALNVGDWGVVALRITVLSGGAALDISQATVKQFDIWKPGQAKTTKTASFTTDGTDGLLEYVWQSGDVDVAGRWKARAVLTFASGLQKTAIGEFVVNP